jgi:hypothetical protein
MCRITIYRALLAPPDNLTFCTKYAIIIIGMRADCPVPQADLKMVGYGNWTVLALTATSVPSMRWTDNRKERIEENHAS